PAMEGVPGVESKLVVVHPVKVAKVVMAITWANPKVCLQRRSEQRQPRGVVKARSHIHRLAEVERRKQRSAAGKWVIPIAGGEHVAARRPKVTLRHPDPVAVADRPIARPPRVVIL